MSIQEILTNRTNLSDTLTGGLFVACESRVKVVEAECGTSRVVTVEAELGT